MSLSDKTLCSLFKEGPESFINLCSYSSESLEVCSSKNSIIDSFEMLNQDSETLFKFSEIGALGQGNPGGT